MIATIILIGVPILIFGLIFWGIKHVCDSITDGAVACFLLHQRKKTTIHYYDHPDRYYDYERNQWFMKSSPG